MKSLLALALFLATAASAQTKCEANINGFKFHTVYIMGNQYNGVNWAYKHIGEETCLTPVTDPSKADAILEVYDRYAPSPSRTDASVSISCTSTSSNSVCTDSSGNMMTVDCRGGSCTSYYGPDPAVATLHALGDWIRNSWNQAEANIYTADHKLLWRSIDQKSHFPDEWPDKIRHGTNSPECGSDNFGTRDLHKYKNYRNWAIQKCGIVFDPLVTIDIKAEAKQTQAKQKQNVQDQMVQNAKDAAEKQKQP